jgi:hypothetical protein
VLLLTQPVVYNFCTFFFFQIDVAGTLYFWDVTVDTASSILLTLSVGLAVDYSAHIGHTYMTVLGSRDGIYFFLPFYFDCNDTTEVA